MASNTSSGVYYWLLDHANGLYACLRILINDSERIYGCFGKSAVESHSFICETALDSQDSDISMLDRMYVKRGRKAVSG